MISINPLDAPGTPFEIELLNPNPTGRRTDGGPLYRVSFQIDKDAYDAFMAMRSGNLRLAARMVVVPDTDEEVAAQALASKPKREKKEPPPKGEHGKLWRELILSCGGLAGFPGVREMLADTGISDGKDCSKAAMCKLFGVESRTFISLAMLREKFGRFPLASAAIERAAMEAEQLR